MSDRSPSPAPKESGDDHRRSRSPSPRESQSPRRRSQSPADNGRGDRNDDDEHRRAGSPNDAGAASRDDRANGGASNNSTNNNGVEGNPGNNVYVANLPLRMSEPELEETFGKFGRIEKCEVILDPATRESRGFAFVTFEDVRDAEDAVKEMHGKELQGRRLRVEIAKRRRGHEKTPGKYLGPRQASSKYGRESRRDSRDRAPRDRSRSRGRSGRSRSRSRDRYARSRYDDRDRYDRRGGYDDRRGGRRSADRYDDRRSRR